MAGITDLQELIGSMSPELQPGEFVFCTVSGKLQDYVHMNLLASFQEHEGLTLVLPCADADNANLEYKGRFRQITLSVHSSLDAVGLTATVAEQLTKCGISANVLAAYYHDHLFVQTDNAERALTALRKLSKSARGL